MNKKNKVDCIFFLVDNYLYIYNIKSKKIIINKYKTYLYQGRIIKPKIFSKLVNEILKKEKISKILTSLNAIIIYESHLKYIDKKVIIDTFENCNFKNIKLINTKDLLNKNKYYIEINNNYLIEYFNNKYVYIPFNKYTNINNIIKMLVKKNNKDTYLIGINKLIPDIANISNKIYYMENHDKYLINIECNKL